MVLRLEELYKVRESFHGIVIVGRAGSKSHPNIHAVGSRHRSRGSVKVDCFAVRRDGTLEYGFSQCSSNPQAASGGTNPEPLQLARIGNDLR